MRGNCSTNQKPGKSENPMDRDQNLIRPEEVHNGLDQQIWAQSDQQFVCKFVETARSIR